MPQARKLTAEAERLSGLIVRLQGELAEAKASNGAANAEATQRAAAEAKAAKAEASEFAARARARAEKVRRSALCAWVPCRAVLGVHHDLPFLLLLSLDS